MCARHHAHVTLRSVADTLGVAPVPRDAAEALEHGCQHAAILAPRLREGLPSMWRPTEMFQQGYHATSLGAILCDDIGLARQQTRLQGFAMLHVF